SRPSLLDPLLVPARVPLVIEAEHVGQTGISGSEIWVYLSGTLIHLDGKLQVLARHPAGVAAATQIEIVGLRIGRRLGLNRLLFLWRQRNAKCFSDLARDLILDFENILEFAIEAFAPQRELSLSVDQLCRDADPVAGAAQATRQHILRTEL